MTKAVYVKFDSKRAFGLEMEFNRRISQESLHIAIRKADKKHEIIRSANYQQDYDNNYWHIKFDRSCGDKPNEGGWEVASYKAKGYKELENVANVVSEIRSAGAQCNDNCAVHVHAEISDYTENNAASLVANWMRAEHYLMQMLPPHRRSNPYCVALTQRYKSLVQKKLGTPREFWLSVRPYSMDNPNRRVSLNMANYASGVRGRQTAEIRVPEGSADPHDVKNWIRFFVHFVDVAKDRFPKSIKPVQSVEDALDVFGLHSEDPFAILSKPLRNTKTWLLKRLQKHATDKVVAAQAAARLAVIAAPMTYDRPPLQVIPNEIRPMDVRPSDWFKEIAEKYRNLSGS